jgi:hypothetical protein
MRGPGKNNQAIGQSKTRALIVNLGIERERSPGTALPRAGHRTLDDDGTPKFLRSRGDVESMQTGDVVDIGARNFLGPGHQVHGVGGEVNHRRTFNADVSHDVEIIRVDDIGDGNRSNTRSRVGEINAPQNSAVGGIGIGVQCVHDVVHGDDK